MATFPFTQPLDNKSFISIVCHLYRISILKLLPFSVLSIAIYNFILFGEKLFPKHAPLFQQLSMFALLLLIPSLAMIFPALDKIAKQQSASFGTIFSLCAQRFLSLMGSILSLILFPLIILGLCIGIYLFLSQQQVAYTYLFCWIMLSSFFILAAMITKTMAPILVLVDEQDANSSVDESYRLVKGYYFKTFIYVLYAILLLILLARLPQIILGFFPMLAKSVPHIALEVVAQVLLILVGPWSFALLLMHKYDLQARHPQATPIEKVPPKTMTKPLAKGTQDKSENDKFNF